MGSPLSPIIDNVCMEAFEKQELEISLRKPNLLVRYVDDVFATWPHGRQALYKFLSQLNSQHPTIQLTMEAEKHLKIAFLDVQIEREETVVITSVLRKKAPNFRGS